MSSLPARALYALPLLLVSLLVDGGGADDAGPPPRLDDGRPHRLEEAASLSCAECHAAVVLEWSESLHALSWVDPHYRAELATKRRKQGCTGCHIPGRLHAVREGERPPTRTEETEPLAHGISCLTCHEGPEGEIRGPFGAETDAHRSVKSPAFTPEGRDRLCATCHATNIGPVIGVARDFFEAGGPAKGQSCVGCHMPTDYRPVAIEPDGTASEERVVRSHRILGPWDREFLASAFGLSVAAGEGRTTLVVANQAGHRVPGLVTRTFTVRARLLDKDGATLSEAEAEISTRAHLPADGVLALDLEGEGEAVQVTLLHHAPGVEEAIEVLSERLP